MSKEPRVSAVLAGIHRESAFVFGVVAKRTYLVRSGTCVVAPEQVPLVDEPEYSNEEGILERDADLVLQREHCDVIVLGHAYSPGRRTFDIRIEVGNLKREIAVFGDRRVERGRGGLIFTPPDAVGRVPLRWEHAYGGVDMVTRKEIGDPIAEFAESEGVPHDPRFGLYAYPRNPLGKGYLVEGSPAALEACHLPNFEDPRQPLTPANVIRGDFMRWPTGPIVAATGFLSHAYFPRSVQMGLPPSPYNDGELRPEHFFELHAGLLQPIALDQSKSMRDRIDPRAAQQSAIGMRTPELEPNARVELVNVHPREASWRFRLAGQVPTMAYRLGGRGTAQLQPKIRTLLLEPDHDRVTVVWAGEVRSELPITPAQLEGIQHGVVWP